MDTIDSRDLCSVAQAAKYARKHIWLNLQQHEHYASSDPELVCEALSAVWIAFNLDYFFCQT